VTVEAPPLRDFFNLNSGLPNTTSFIKPDLFSTLNLPPTSHPPFSLSRDPWYRSVKMAAAIKAINAKIRSNKVLDYFCSTREFSQFRIPAQLVGTSTVSACLAEHVAAIHAAIRFEESEENRQDEADSICRFLGPSIEFWYPDCGSDGYTERS
jgi:hypothetical protein